MPKIIENVRGQLVAEARRQVAAYGYTSTTIRSVAKACGVGTGTVYNYFPSKDMLIAAFMLEDWKKQLAAMLNEALEMAAGLRQPTAMLEKLTTADTRSLPLSAAEEGMVLSISGGVADCIAHTLPWQE